jgi:hypothetical protein
MINCACKQNILPRSILEWETERTQRKGRYIEILMNGVRRSVNKHGLTEESFTERECAEKLRFV